MMILYLNTWIGVEYKLPFGHYRVERLLCAKSGHWQIFFPENFFRQN
jgi:hypothetical protein